MPLSGSLPGNMMLVGASPKLKSMYGSPSSRRVGSCVPDRGRHPRVVPVERFVLLRAARWTVEARLPNGAGPRLVDQVIAQNPGVVGHRSGQRRHHRAHPILDGDVVRSRFVGPETVEGRLDRRVGEVVEREVGVGVHGTVGDGHPLGEPIAAERGSPTVLVQVDEHQQTVRGDRVDRLAEGRAGTRCRSHLGSA